MIYCSSWEESRLLMSGTSLYSGELLGKGKADILLKFSFMASQKMEMSLKIK